MRSRSRASHREQLRRVSLCRLVEKRLIAFGSFRPVHHRSLHGLSSLIRKGASRRHSGQNTLGTVLGTDWFKKLQNHSKSQQMASVHRSHLSLPIQKVRKSLEADKRCRLSILSLLRMPISPLRLRAQALERNTFQINRSTAVRRPRF